MNAAATLPGKKKKPAVTIAVPYWVREFALIRWGVVSLAASVAVGVAAVVVSNAQLRDASATRTHVQQVRDAAYARYADADNEKREIRTFQPQFLVMRERGLVGEENRLSWLDAIRRIQEERRLQPISYEIAPQQPVALEPGIASGDYQLHASRMRLHMDLLHELDLFNFLEDLRARGYFAVQDCAIKRLGANLNQADAPTLAADCTLNWLTLTPGAPAVGVPFSSRSKP
ncbi:hypothetical protein H3H36_15320 [Duganella sp. FT3S]|uniref:Uncharacterized protein n=1 Tax=Rugamonas fusca TaxID=2758568 RepID=A0A7W2EIV1_9BURK|nr:hypothetical protein [Rugamonas fusca]MBA5606728.1 hypothetical protein [Rugamonas fusca]